MIDYRLNTFLNLCETKSYTETAKRLHMTQPAVTQHIQFLEEEYKVKLFEYKNRKLNLTDNGLNLYEFVKSIRVNSDKMKDILSNSKVSNESINFGATLTIGEYVMPKLLIDLKEESPDVEVSMRVSNTERLLEFLNNGTIDFAILEGHFNKNDYESYLFSREKFICVGNINEFPDENKSIYNIEDIYEKTLIIREAGSGTREILEQILYEKNLNLNNFKRMTTIGNMNVIKMMVEARLGITFLYEKVVEKEIYENKLKEIKLKNFDIEREFNFIFLKDSFYARDYLKWYKYFLDEFNRI